MDRYKSVIKALTSADLAQMAQGYPPKIELLEPVEIVDELNDVFSIKAKEFVRFGKNTLVFEVHAENDVIFASYCTMNNFRCEGNATLIDGGAICGNVMVDGDFEVYSDFRTTSSITVGGDLTIHGDLFADGYGSVDVAGKVYVYGSLYANRLEVGKKITCNNVVADFIRVNGVQISCANKISAS